MEAEANPPWFDALTAALDGMGFPVSLRSRLRHKLETSTFDAGSCFSFEEFNVDSVVDEEGKGVRPTPYSLHCIVDMAKDSDVFLADHMISFAHPQSRDILREVSGLPAQISELIGVNLPNGEAPNAEENVTAVWNAWWPHLGVFSTVSNADIDSYPTFYLRDQVALSIRHSSSPNFACFPIFIGGTDMTLMWPISDLAAGDMVTRDYLPSCPSSGSSEELLVRKVRMLAFRGGDTSDLCTDILELRSFAAENRTLPPPPACDMEAAASFAPIEPLPQWSSSLDMLATLSCGRDKPPSRPLKVFCDDESVLKESLLHEPAFVELVEEPGEADAYYLAHHVKEENFEGIESDEYDKSNVVTNQFWFNGMLISKEHLVRTVNKHERRTKASPLESILPTSYDTTKAEDLLAFVVDYSVRAASEESDNTWIMKRFRGRQSIDYPITTSLTCALRHLEVCPRLACKYASNCCTHRGRKFDLRCYVMVTSLEPLVMYRHHMFSIRCANNKYKQGQDLENFQSHFTVMNGLGGEREDHLSSIRGAGVRSDPTMEEFIQAWAEENPDIDWETQVQPKVDALCRKTLEAVVGTYRDEPPHPSGQSIHPNAGWSINQPNACTARAMYGFDIILTKNDESGGNVQPKLLEVQWAPDVDWAVVLRPSLWDDILKCLFLGVTDSDAIVEI